MRTFNIETFLILSCLLGLLIIGIVEVMMKIGDHLVDLDMRKRTGAALEKK